MATQGLFAQGLGGKLKTLEIVLQNYERTIAVPIRAIVSDFTIYENIFNRTLSGVMTIIDSIGFQSGYGPFQILGQEWLTISWSIPDESKPVRSMEFFLYEIAPIENQDNLKHKRYVVSFCSAEELRESVVNIQKAYNKPCSDIVSDVVKTFLESSKKLDVEPTMGSQSVVIPRMSPFDTIDFCRRRSISKEKYTSASYLFFETFEGFKYTTIENLIAKGQEKIKTSPETYTYYITQGDLQRVGSDEDGENDNSDPRNYNRQEFKTLFDFTQDHKTDTIEKIKTGAFQSDVTVFDPVKVSFTKTIYQFDVKKTTVLGKFPENTSKFVNDFSKLDKNRGTWFIKAQDSTQPDIHIADITLNRAAYMGRFAQNMFTANIIGDPALSVGDVIRVPNIPAFRDPDGLGNTDQLLSGDFLVAALTHKFGQETYVCEIELYKNGYAKSVDESIDQRTS